MRQARKFEKILFLSNLILNKNPEICLDVHVKGLFQFFLCRIFVTALIKVLAIVRIMLSTTCEETTVWLAILSSTAGHSLPSSKP